MHLHCKHEDEKIRKIQYMYKIFKVAQNHFGDKGCKQLIKAFWPKLVHLQIRNNFDKKATTRLDRRVVSSFREGSGLALFNYSLVQ